MFPSVHFVLRRTGSCLKIFGSQEQIEEQACQRSEKKKSSGFARRGLKWTLDSNGLFKAFCPVTARHPATIIQFFMLKDCARFTQIAVKPRMFIGF
jgi:hypothetical protein